MPNRFLVIRGVTVCLRFRYASALGATAAEAARPIQDDNIVLNPAFDATRAITIHGRPERIWPWLAQMGYGRAGFYGYDLIENLGSGKGIRSARTILPGLQNPRPGEPLPLSVAATLVFGTVEPDHCIVWRAPDSPPSGVFIWQLVPVDAEHTRLISRIRWRYVNTSEGVALGLFTEFADHVAVRAILCGVRDRVEGRVPESLAAQAAEIAAWLLAFAEFVILATLVLFHRKWLRIWLLALGAGLLLFVLLYADLPVLFAAPLPWLYLAFVIWRWRRDSAKTEARPVSTQRIA